MLFIYYSVNNITVKKGLQGTKKKSVVFAVQKKVDFFVSRYQKNVV